jgi:Fic family protein
MSADDRGPLLCAPDAKAKPEARNGVEQLDYITELVEGGARELRESHVLGLQDIRDVYPCGGKYRTALHNVFIANSAHTLPEAAFVRSLVRDAVDWINRQRGQRSALERAAYALWRFNWIHPFAGGNGRTRKCSRASSQA